MTPEICTVYFPPDWCASHCEQWLWYRDMSFSYRDHYACDVFRILECGEV